MNLNSAVVATLFGPIIGGKILKIAWFNMNIFMIILIAFGLAMDSFAVSVARGIAIVKSRVSNALIIALFFGLFQAIMPLFGWLAGLGVRDLISGIDHWIAFGILCLIGCKMILESNRKTTGKKRINSLNVYVLLLLSVATSIDALAVGLSFSFLRTPILTPIIIIGIITFLLSFLGFFAGNKFGHLFERKIGIAGGLILIGIGIKIVIEHLTYPV